MITQHFVVMATELRDKLPLSATSCRRFAIVPPGAVDFFIAQHDKKTPFRGALPLLERQFRTVGPLLFREL